MANEGTRDPLGQRVGPLVDHNIDKFGWPPEGCKIGNADVPGRVRPAAPAARWPQLDPRDALKAQGLDDRIEHSPQKAGHLIRCRSDFCDS